MKTLAALSLVALATAAFADQAAYTGKAENGWVTNWSWAKVTLSGPVINVNSEKAWQALAFHHDPQKASQFKAVTFQACGEGERIQLRATVDKKPLKEAFLPPLTKTWTTFTVTFKQLGLTGQNFDGLWIQAQKVGKFQVRSVVFKS